MQLNAANVSGDYASRAAHRIYDGPRKMLRAVSYALGETESTPTRGACAEASVVYAHVQYPHLMCEQTLTCLQTACVGLYSFPACSPTVVLLLWLASTTPRA